MSSEGDSAKSVLSESNEKSGTDNTDSSQDSHDVKDAKAPKEANDTNVEKKNDEQAKLKDTPAEESENSEKKEEEEEEKNDKPKVNNVEENDTNKNDKSSKKEENKNNDSEKEEEEDGGSDKDDKEVPLLDQPLEKSGKRERKNVQRFDEEFSSEQKSDAKIEIENGVGTALGDIPRVEASISRFKIDDLKLLHRILFKVVGKTTLIKKNIKKFNGFEFKRDSEEFTKKTAFVERFEIKQLKSVCEMLDLQKSGNKDDIVARIMDFLLEPKDSGKPVGGGRPKRTAAVRANNRGYSSHDDYSSDEKHASRARRDKGKRPNLKDESSSESDKDFQPSDASDEQPRNKRKRGSRKKTTSDEDNGSDVVSVASSDESDDEPKNKRKKAVKTNNKAKPKGTPGRRGRKPGTSSKKNQKSKKKDESSEDEDEESDHKEDGSSSEDEPLAKKAKSTQPPTDDEIKACVEKILEGANLEEITMKNVCQRVYAHYPDFDLAHKKDFIKTTVKSLIST